MSLRNDIYPFNEISPLWDQQLGKMLEMKVETLVGVEFSGGHWLPLRLLSMAKVSSDALPCTHSLSSPCLI